MHRHAGWNVVITIFNQNFNIVLRSFRNGSFVPRWSFSFLSVGQNCERIFHPFLIGGFLTQWCTWLARNRMICSSGRQFELLIEWKGYVHWAPSIVSLSLRCAEAVMKSSWTRSQRSCDRSSERCLFQLERGRQLDVRHKHTHQDTLWRTYTDTQQRDSNKRLVQK